MPRFLPLAALLALLCAPAFAACEGENLIDILPAPERAALEAAVDRQPFSRGNFWRATRGAAVLHLIGTYHLDDPRHAATMARLGPVIAEAATLLVEAGPVEEQALQQAMAEKPATLFTTGPTLPETLSEAEWQTLASAMRARGIPPFMAAKFQPWYVSMMLGIPACAMSEISQKNGLDQQAIKAADAAAVPVRALEPYDTVLTLFGDLPEEEQLAMIRSALPLEAQGPDYAVTLADAYFAGESRLIWEFMRLEAQKLPDHTAESADAEYARLEEAVIFARNRAWLPVIEAALERGPAVAAFGALHLPGRDGVLELLRREGFTIEALPL